MNRSTSWRKATLKSLVRSLLIYQRIETTLSKAKALRPVAEKIISLAKKDSLSNKRMVYKILGDHKLVSELFNETAKRFNNRTGGYLRILKLGNRRGDNAQLALVELTELKKEEKKKKKGKSEKVQKEKKPAVLEAPKEKKAEEKKTEEKKTEEKAVKQDTAVKEKPPISKKPTKKFLGGLKGIFKKERDSL